MSSVAMMGELAEIAVNLAFCGVAYALIVDASATFSFIKYIYLAATAFARCTLSMAVFPP
jgi:hypothetical protein